MNSLSNFKRRLAGKLTWPISAKTLGILLAAFAWCTSANAQGLRVSDGSPAELEALRSGEQLVLSDQIGQIKFAGRDVKLAGFSGILGYASDVGYIVVIDGTATSAQNSVGRGRMLMFPPFGGEATVTRFDAARLRDAWDDDLKSSAPGTYSSLSDLASGQSSGIFFGRLGRTNFNAAASGVAAQELAKRSVVGSAAVREIRFETAPQTPEMSAQVVELFVSALIQADAQTVAQLMDPLPFGNSDLRSGAAEARQAMAEALIAERAWPSLLGNSAEITDAGNDRWLISGAATRVEITLRPTTDFTFIKSIRTGR